MKVNKNELGYTLVGVLAIFTISSIIAISLVIISFNSLKASKTEVDNQAVFYIAEAGLNKAVNKLEKGIIKINENYQNIDIEKQIKDLRKKVIEDTNDLSFEKVKKVKKSPSVELDIREGKSENEYIISSTGFIDNQKRTVEKTVEISWSDHQDDGDLLEFPEFAIYSFEEMNLGYGINLTMKVGSNGKVNLNNGAYVSEIIDNHDLRRPALPKFPEFPTYPNIENNEEMNLTNTNKEEYFQSNSFIRKKDVSLTNSTLTFHIDKGEANIYIDSLNMKNSNLIVKGEGKVNIYIKGKLNMEANSNIDGTQAKLMTIYTRDNIQIKNSSIKENFARNVVYSRGSLNSNGGNLNSHCYAEKGIDLTGGTLKGSIYSDKDISITNGTIHNEIIYAPYGEVTISTGAFTSRIYGERVNVKEGTMDPNHFGLMQADNNPLSPIKLYTEDNNEGESGNNSNGKVDFKPTSPLHEVDK